MRFTLLHHTGHGAEHYDFLLEREGEERLKTWRMTATDFESPQMIVQSEDHRAIYLDYEGEISGDRGRVTRWDTGTYETSGWTDSEIMISLNGRKIKGIVSLSRLSDTGGQDSKWLLQINPGSDSPSTGGSAS